MKKTKARESSPSQITPKRRKINSEEFDEQFSNSSSTPANSDQVKNSLSSISDYVSDTLLSSNESSEIVEGNETENSSTYINNKFSGEATSEVSEIICVDSTESMESTKPASSHPKRIPSKKMPSESEMEEFFAVAAKYEQKRFAAKYNYDIVKDVPLEGRYQWVRLKP